MKQLTVQQIREIFNRSDLDVNFCIALSDNLHKYRKEFYIDTPIRRVRFLAQAVHETMITPTGSVRIRENLNYSIKGIKRISLYFRTHLTLANLYGRSSEHAANQKAIANVFYADENRRTGYKLGNTNYGDGWFYRGFGIFQVTGKFNIKNNDAILKKRIRYSILNNAGFLKHTYEASILSGMAFWYDVNAYACRDTNCVTNKVNKGLPLLEKRRRLRTAIRIKKLLIK